MLPGWSWLLRRRARYKVAYSGRGAGKSWQFARALLIRGLQRPERILCAREYQASIRDSVHYLLERQIDLCGLSGFYRVDRRAIYGINGTEFVFTGVRHNPTAIKSMEGVTIAWVEEAERVSEASWEILVPTIRETGSEIWVSFNPDLATDPTYRRFVEKPPPDAIVKRYTFRDNPKMSDELEAERLWMQRTDPDAYANIWEGEPRSATDAQILRGKWQIDAFEIPADAYGPYLGADWGFAQDPTALVQLYISADRRTLMVADEATGVGVDIDDTPALFDRVDGVREYTIRADSSRPETISHMRRAGFDCRGARKGKGSVEDGIAFLRSFDVILIHDRCRMAQQEARLYCYEIDALTGDIKPRPRDEHNHIWDAARYALEPLIRQRSGPLIGRAS
jgi:phage terminase large subunit